MKSTIAALLLIQTLTCAANTEARRNRTVPFQVIGAGLGKTGTKTLHHALDILGISPVHDSPVPGTVGGLQALWTPQIHLKKLGKYEPEDGAWDKAEQWDQILGDYAAIVDQPAPWFVPNLARAYPDAKVVLTVRDTPKQWLESYKRTIYDRQTRFSKSWAYQSQAFLRWLIGYETEYDIFIRAMMYNDKYILEPQEWWYTSHIELVRKFVPADRLLEFNAKDGWGPLCQFLGKEVPTVPFPHSNARNTFQKATERGLRQVEREMMILIAISLTALLVAGYAIRRYL